MGKIVVRQKEPNTEAHQIICRKTYIGLSKKEKLAAVQSTATRCQKSGKKLNGLTLEQFVALTGYKRTYAAWLLTKQGPLIYRQEYYLGG